MRPLMGIVFSRNRLATPGSIVWIAAMARAEIARLIDLKEALAFEEGIRMSV